MPEDFKFLGASSQKLQVRRPPNYYDKTLFLHERMKTSAAYGAFKAERRIRRELYYNKAANDPNPYNAYVRMLKRERK